MNNGNNGQTISQCSGILYDSGGAADSYQNSENFTLTICAENPGDAIQLDFSFFDTQQNGDFLTIYDGADTSASVIGVYSGNVSPGVVQATNASGCLTVEFSSNGFMQRPGFAATISCATPCQDIEAFIATTDPPAGLGGNIVISQGDSVDFTGGATFSIDGTGATYDWDFGGEASTTTGSGDTVVSHTFSTIGTFVITLTVTDTNPTGCSDSATIVVQVLGPYLLIDQTTYSVDELIEDILINTSCAEVSNIISSTGNDFGSTNGIGYFSGNGLSFPFTEGIILTTGDASEAGGPESGTLSSGSLAWPGDEDLETAIPDLNIGDTNNATFIQFDFVPLSPNVSFNFVFASEEYGGFQCQFTDAFAFLLTDNETGVTTNLAIVPGTNDPISVLSVRDDTHNSSCNSVNEDFFEAFYGGTGLPEIDSPTDFRGHTVSMAAQSTVVPNNSYTIKLVIADDGDTQFDAAVFIEGGSFDLGGNLGDDVTIEGGNALCLGDTMTLDSGLPTAEHIWYYNDEVIDDESSSLLEISAPGNYRVDIIFGEECSTSDSIIVEFKPFPTIEAVSDFSRCDSGTPTFDLTENNAFILGSQNPDDFNITYHNSIEDAENDNAPIETNLTNYTISTNTETIFIRIEDSITETCFVTGSFNLILTGAPSISDVSDLVLCDDISNDDVAEFNLELQNPDILGGLNPDDYNISFYTSFDDANLSQNALPLIYTSVTNQPIYVRLDSVDDAACFNVTTDPLFNLIVNNKATATAPSDLSDCDASGTAALESTFDLDQQTATILGTQDPTTFTVTYHATPEEANSGANPLSSPLTTTTRTIYVRVEEDGLPDCYETTQFEITVNPNPEVADQNTTICSTSTVDLILGDDADGPSVASYELTAITPASGLVADAANATVGTTLASDAIALDVWTNATTTPLDVVYSFVPVSSDNCTGATFTVTVTVSPLPIPEPVIIPSQCDDDTDGLQTFDMSGVASQVVGTQADMVVSYHATQQDAEDSINALGNSITTTEPDVQTIYIRLENSLTGCYAVSTTQLVVDALPVVNLEDNYVICSDTSSGGIDSVEVDPGLSSAIYSFIWRDEFGAILSTASTYTVDQGGIYSLEVSYSNSSTACSAPLEIFTVSESGPPAVIVDVLTEDFADTHVVMATATGTGIYEFSLDQGPWQDSGTFIGVTPGEHAINVRDVNGCGTTVMPFSIVDYPRYFTPNNDGYHDTWNIPAFSGQLGSRILIFDRYGKLLKQISPAGDGWDGTFNGRPMPTNDYWFLVNYNDLTTGEPKQLRANFSLKR